MNELIKLYIENNHISDKWGTPEELIAAFNRHQYLTTYGPLFKRLKNRNNRILEIGIAEGDSLNLWEEYFTQSVIYGVDNNYPQKRAVELNSRVRVIVGDAYTPEMITLLKDIGKFDLIIDDGSHYLEDIKFVVDNYCELLTDDGILIIEDVNNGICPETKKKYAEVVIDWFPKDLKKYIYAVYDNRENSKVYIDTLVICDKYEKSRDSK